MITQLKIAKVTSLRSKFMSELAELEAIGLDQETQNWYYTTYVERCDNILSFLTK